MQQAVAAALWSALLVSVVLTAAGVTRRAWPVLWAAAMLSAGFSIAAGFSVGPLVFLLTCCQLAAALQLRWDGRLQRPWQVVPAGVLLWVLVVPVQLLGMRWFPWLIAFPLVTLIATVAILVGPRRPPARVVR